MGSRPWRRTCVPPMPALIPIAALRAKQQQHQDLQQNCTNNNTTAVKCSPCGQRCLGEHLAADDDDIDVDDDVGDVDEEEVRLTDYRGEDDSGDQKALAMDEVLLGGCEEGSFEGPQRLRRRPRQLDDAEPIDETTSRDRSEPQAPARRARPERHRKSDRRRHRSDRLLRKRSTSGSTTSSACSVTSSRTTASINSISSGNSSAGSISRRVSRHTQQQNQQETEANVPTADSRPPTNPRVNPIFVWVRQEDTRIVDVRCEDYDKRNRILLTKTAHGWRAIPRTETLATTLEEVPVSVEQQQQHQEDSLSRPTRKPRSRKSGKTKRCRPSSQQSTTSIPICSPVTVEHEQNADDETEPASPAWSTPVNIESHLPSHTIPVPRRSPEVVRTLVNADSCSGVSAEIEDGVNSAEAHAPKCCSIVSDVSSPLDNLLAVAELEFKQHQVHVIDQQEQDDVIDLDKDLLGEEEELEPTPHVELSSATPHCDIEDEDIDDDDDVDDDIVDKEYDSDQINNFAENSSEEIPTDGDAEADGDIASRKQEHADDCDYTEDDENHMAMTDILDRLEQSLQSPMEGDREVETIDEEMEDCNSYVQEEDADEESVHLNEVEETQEENLELGDVTNENIDQQEDKIDEREDESSVKDTEYVTQTSKEMQKDESEQPTDLSVKSSTEPTDKTIEDVSEDELPTDLSTHTNKEVEAQEDDIQPTDLSIRKHSTPSPALRIETLRSPSQNSETIQSPQPSGIPAVPPSPDIFPTKINSKSLFLESLLSSASPKLALTPEVTITRNQKEPLDLGKSRKSASPTVSCSEEAKPKFVDGEPATKRVKIEDITLKNLLQLEKQKSESKPAEPIRQESQSAVETSRLLELLTSDNETDPLTQLKQLLADTEVNIPDPLLVPKDRLSLILSSPAREIPKLLAQRPELRLPEALAYPQLLQDPDILVITLAQLQTILQKQNQPIALQESKPKEPKLVEKPAPKPVLKSSKPDISIPMHSNDYQRYQNVANVQRQQHVLEAQMKQQKDAALANMRPNGGLANDIDAATTAAFNQMLWLPYLNHLEAAAMACGNNTEFLKALNSVFPSTSASYPGQMADMPPLFTSASSRFGAMPGSGFPPIQSSIDYANPLEMAMWQEAMMQANLQQRPKMSMEASASLKHAAYRESERNAMIHNAKKYQANSQRVHSSARTSPISHTFHQQRIPATGQMHPFVHNGYAMQGVRHNLQIPQYNPGSLSHQQQQALLQHQQQQQHHQQHAAVAAAKRSSVTYRNKPDPVKHFQNASNAYSKYSQYMSQQAKLPSPPVPTKPETPPKPRVTCKSLQNLLSPKRAEETHKKPTETNKPTATQPMDLSGARPPFSKLKVKQNLLDPVVASFGAKLWKHEDVPEVGSTTEEMTSTQLHETQTHLWHPLFGK